MIKVMADLVLMKFLPGWLCPHVAAAADLVSLSLPTRAIIPFTGAPASGANYLAEEAVLNTISLGPRASICGLGLEGGYLNI